MAYMKNRELNKDMAILSLRSRACSRQKPRSELKGHRNTTHLRWHAFGGLIALFSSIYHAFSSNICKPHQMTSSHERVLREGHRARSPGPVATRTFLFRLGVELGSWRGPSRANHAPYLPTSLSIHSHPATSPSMTSRPCLTCLYQLSYTITLLLIIFHSLFFGGL